MIYNIYFLKVCDLNSFSCFQLKIQIKKLILIL